jgi:predicted nucleic acid-binding protein
MLAALEVLPVSWIEGDRYAAQEEEARRRMASRDVNDWPIVALALALSLPIWSQDKDFEQSGLPVYTTGTLLDLLDG